MASSRKQRKDRSKRRKGASSKKTRKPKQPKGTRPPVRGEIDVDELKAIVERAKEALTAEEHDKLEAAVDTLGFLTRELEAKRVSVARLKKMLFGASTEKADAVLAAALSGAAPEEGGASEKSTAEDSATPDATGARESRPKRKGHGRNGAAAYRGAKKTRVSHEELSSGDSCPRCEDGKVYPVKEPGVLVRVTGMAPLQATVYELEKLRCNLCGEVFTAREPPGIGTKKYDETVASMIALLKYGTGLPFNRLEKLQLGLGIPLPSSTQWELMEKGAGLVLPAYHELVRQAAQGEVLHNDDTTMRILDLVGKRREKAIEAGELDADRRVGIFTSGIVSRAADHQIALFFTGSQHAGENLSDVLAGRADELQPPIQMCDALSTNTTGELDVILSRCLVHARRNFVEVASSFPEECGFLIKELGKVYEVDADAKKRELTSEARLRLHQESSGPVMDRLHQWLEDQIEQRRTEPNSGLGKAITYMRQHWNELTLFLREPGAPLDNNLCERALKKAILHRKNAYFFKSENGARVGDVFMSLIHTAELCRAKTFEYLVALQRHAAAVAADPAAWMPWNYTAAMEQVAGDASSND